MVLTFRLPCCTSQLGVVDGSYHDENAQNGTEVNRESNVRPVTFFIETQQLPIPLNLQVLVTN